MKKEDIFTKLFQFSIPTFYNWQREKRPIIKLIEKYFSKEDLEEFLDKGSVEILDEFSAFRVACKNDPAFKQFLEFKEFQAYKEKQLSGNGIVINKK